MWGIHRKCGQEEKKKTMFYCSVWNENGGLNLAEKKKWLGSSMNLFACFLVLLGCCVPSESLLVLDAGIIGLGKGDCSGFRPQC